MSLRVISVVTAREVEQASLSSTNRLCALNATMNSLVVVRSSAERLVTAVTSCSGLRGEHLCRCCRSSKSRCANRRCRFPIVIGEGFVYPLGPPMKCDALRGFQLIRFGAEECSPRKATTPACAGSIAYQFVRLCRPLCVGVRTTTGQRRVGSGGVARAGRHDSSAADASGAATDLMNQSVVASVRNLYA